MSVVTQWEGFTSGVLTFLQQMLDSRKAEFGVNSVTVGETFRGYNHPAAFVYPRGEGTQSATDSGRKGLEEYRIPIQILVVMRHTTDSQDAEVLLALEKIMDALEAYPPPSIRKVRIAAPGRITLRADNATGAMDTYGTVDVDYYKGHEQRYLRP